MKICKILLIYAFVISGFFSFSFGYYNEGFFSYEEGNHGISFNCKNQCSINLGIKDNAYSIILDGSISGTGTMELIAQNGKEKETLYFGKISPKGNAKIIFPNYEVNLYKIPPKNNLIMQISGYVEGNLDIRKNTLTFKQKILRGRNDFWTNEPIRQYSINYRYGTSINGISIVQYGYIIFIVISLFILLLGIKKQNINIFKSVFYLGICLFLLIGIRNTISYTIILNEGLSGYKDDQTFFDFKDYIPFVNAIRNKLDLDNFEKKDCKIFMYINDYHWAINFHKEFFFKPCERVDSPYQSDYLIYYDTPISSMDKDKEILLDFNGNYLLDNKIK